MADQTRYAADPDRLALVLPGGGYTPARPLLHLTRLVLLSLGWTVREVWWRPPAWPNPEERTAWVAEQASAALAEETASRVLLVGKSLGSPAAGLAAERALPAVWLTPLLVEPAVVDRLRAATAPTLLVGGAADALWHADRARELGHALLEVPEADHALEVPADPVRSARILVEVTDRLNRFVAALD
ncbi:hypothetical protein [Actinosynnema sp. NPDC020468]|uniref:hypothetical protein n=1 Tax=Actinosynnema sp. NPDC020468 TaxID=3154488 RepID=UPI0033E4B59A